MVTRPSTAQSSKEWIQPTSSRPPYLRTVLIYSSQPCLGLQSVLFIWYIFIKFRINVFLTRFKYRVFYTFWRCMSRASYCNVYVSRPTRWTNSYNESLLIIKRSTCFGLFSPSSGATFLKLYRNGISRYVRLVGGYSFKKRLKSPKHVERLMINKDSL